VNAIKGKGRFQNRSRTSACGPAKFGCDGAHCLAKFSVCNHLANLLAIADNPSVNWTEIARSQARQCALEKVPRLGFVYVLSTRVGFVSPPVPPKNRWADAR
jgi:hypothetical protein